MLAFNFTFIININLFHSTTEFKAKFTIGTCFVNSHKTFINTRI